MKQKDIILIIVIIFVSGVLSIIVSSLLITSPKNRQTKVEVVDKISDNFPQANTKYFNNTAVDPTRTITIGTNGNLSPFNATTTKH